MATTQINLRVDADIKTAAEDVCSDIGLTLSAAINIYLRRIARDRCIPFALTSGTADKPEGSD